MKTIAILEYTTATLVIVGVSDEILDKHESVESYLQSKGYDTDDIHYMVVDGKLNKHTDYEDCIEEID